MARVSVLVGSLRKGSLNAKLAQALGGLAGDRLEFDYPSLDLPLYNDDLWETPPDGVLTLKESIKAADAVLFVTPEYNRSFTPAIKNAIDWGSRPRADACWPGKPAGIVGASPGKIGTAVAQAQLRSILGHVGMILMGQPEVYLQVPKGLFDDDGTITDASTATFLSTYLERFAAFIETVTD
jgi:chromate reductase, NAD(P)H dehydrogenase (quinone)